MSDMQIGDRVHIRKELHGKVWRGWVRVTHLHSGNYDWQYTGVDIVLNQTHYFNDDEVRFHVR